METYRLLHTALYAKHWYKREKGKTIWEDLQVILTLDDYMGEHMTKLDMVNVLLRNTQRINKRAFELTEFVLGISPQECWKTGYYTKGNSPWLLRNKNEDTLPEYDYHEAVVRYCLSMISCCTLKEIGVDKLPMPDYKKGLGRPDGIKKKKLKEMFG